MKTIWLLIRLSRPLFLLGGVLVYALGAGIATYLGIRIDWGGYFLGQFWVTTIQLAGQYLNEYFDAPQDIQNKNRTPFTGGSGVLGPDGLPRRTALIAALGCLAVTASLTVLLLSTANMSPVTLLIMAIGFSGAVLYSVPPVRLSTTGYGELATSFLVANLVPAFAFLLQSGDLHRLLAMSTFPLTLLHLAMMLAFEFPDYATDLRLGKRTLLVRMGWQRAVLLHNLLILFAYITLGLAVIFGLPFLIALPAFLTLPLGLLQIWQMRRIADGARPNWNALTLTAIALFSVVAYLLTFTFWTR
jgi:1,4-dihydroxy-2-naphthoate octaprenyltransferase